MRHPRPRSLVAAAAAAAALLCGLPAAAEAQTWSVPTFVAVRGSTDLTNTDLENDLMVRINKARVEHGLRRIASFDVCTDDLAEKWGARIARTGLFEHRNQNEVIRRCDNSWAGETLVRGAGLTPADMVDLWLDSPGHRDILLSPRATRAGIAITQDSQGRVIGVVNLVRHG